VLTFAEAARHPHALARRGHVAVGEVTQPAPAPRYSRTPGEVRRAPPERGALGREALADWGFAEKAIDRLVAQGLGLKGP
jgi:alpha-methylacyl-CoA racemase